jgi:hypothetical protein
MKPSREQIEAFAQFQRSGWSHPLTCGSGRRTDEHHLDGEGLLVLTEDGILKCPYCDYTQIPHGFIEGMVQMVSTIETCPTCHRPKDLPFFCSNAFHCPPPWQP